MPLELTGKRVGKLTVVRRARRKRGRLMWLCVCDCGGTVIAVGSKLNSGHPKSCGCLHAEVMTQVKTTHGDNKKGQRAPEYRAWSNMLTRCYNSKWPRHYKNYGGRGISVCDRWRYSYVAFLEDMGRKPSPAHSIDREDNDGNYEPLNCKWSTRAEQAKNRRPFQHQNQYTTGSRRRSVAS